MAIQFSAIAKRLGLDPAKLGLDKPGQDKAGAADAAPAGTAAAAAPASEAPEVITPKPKRGIIDSSSSQIRALGGSPAIIEEFYFPPEILGGMCPQVAGAEEETAWNAAAEACDSERVHIVWQAFDSRVWYLAVRSSELASHPHSWCPFAAVLPGMKDSLTPPVCYTYYGDEIASMMTITEDGLHIYRGTNPIVRAKAERTARELGNASIVDLIPEHILSYAPVPWYSVSLFEERARRILATLAILTSLSLSGLAIVIWMLAGLALVTSRHSLADAQARTQSEVLDLMNAAQNLRATPVREALTKFVELNEGLLNINGYLEIYSVDGGKTRWRAVVPSNITADRIAALGGKTIDTKATGTVIGNAAEIDFEAGSEKR